MPQIDYLLIGHVTADVVPDGRLLGGTVSYATPVARAFGHRVGLLTSAAASEPLIEPIRTQADVMVRLAEATTTFSNIYTNNIRTQYVHATAAPLTYEMLPVGWTDAPLVHLAPLVDEVDPSIASRFPDSTVLLTPQGYLRSWDADGHVHFKRWLDKDVLAAIDIVIFSKHDIAGAPELEFEFAEAAEHVVVTDGAHGGTYYHKGQPQRYEPHPVVELEPTGAGDVFAASLLGSLLAVNHNMNTALRVAARLAAISVTRLGAWQEFSPEEIQQTLQEAKDDS